MPESILLRYVAFHNHGVRTGDFSRVLKLFSREASMSFHGRSRPIGPFQGREAIAGAFAAHPPDDELVLGAVETKGTQLVSSRYRWRAHPDAPGGQLHLRVERTQIVELTIHIDPRGTNPSLDLRNPSNNLGDTKT
jgi:steroid Delta-isomerase